MNEITVTEFEILEGLGPEGDRSLYLNPNIIPDARQQRGSEEIEPTANLRLADRGRWSVIVKTARFRLNPVVGLVHDERQHRICMVVIEGAKRR